MFTIFLEYHNALVENGVTGHNLAEFKSEVVTIFLEKVCEFLKSAKKSPKKTADTMLNIFDLDEEKAKEIQKILENGFFIKCFLILTSLYVMDKENFMISNE